MWPNGRVPWTQIGDYTVSIISDNLEKLANDLAESSAWDEIKSAAIDTLSKESGLSKTAATAQVEALEVGVTRSALPSTKDLSDILLKVANYVGDLEAKIVTNGEELTSRDEQLSKVAEEQMIGAMAPFVENGFSSEEALVLAKLPEGTLQKLAHNVRASAAPISMGYGAGMDADSMDPLTRFLLS